MSKKFLRTVIAVLLVCSMLTVPTAFAESATVTGNHVNVRSGPGTNYPVVVRLAVGTTVNVIDCSDPDWFAISYGDISGYVSSQYLRMDEPETPVIVDEPEEPGETDDGTPAELEIPEVQGIPGHINAMYVRFRSGPSTDSTILGQYNKGKSLVITGTEDDWTACVIDGKAGYVYSQYVTRDDEADPEPVPDPDPTPAPTPTPTPEPPEDDEVVVGGEDDPAPTPEPTEKPSEETVVEAGEPAETGKPGRINAMYVRFRSGPGTDSEILGTYNKGKELTITGVSGDWTACVIDGRSGYVFSQYVTETEEKPAQPDPDPTPTDGPTQTPAPTAKPTPTPTAKPTPTPTPTPAPTPTVSQVEEKTGYIFGDYVRFRSGPGTNYSILGSYNRGKELTITGVSGDWTACVIDGKSGFVFSRYVLEGSAEPSPTPTPAPTPTPEPDEDPEPDPTPTPTPTPEDEGREPGYITGNNVRLRGAPSMSGQILRELFYGNGVTILGVSGDWTHVIYEGETGYVYSQYVARGEYNKPRPSTPEDPDDPDDPGDGDSSSEGQRIADYAQQFVGYPYVWGGKSPSTGFDCSGLVYYVYKQFGYSIHRIAGDQAGDGVHVDPDDLQPGDILCFYSSADYIGHSAIYIGNGLFVHAANSRTGVVISDLSGYYSARGFEARRIVR